MSIADSLHNQPEVVRPHALAEYIRLHREAKAMSMRELARHVGVHQSLITRTERGLYAQPAPEILHRIANALEVPAEDLFALAGYEVPENLPTYPAYLRSKYDMSPEAARQLTEYFAFVAERFGIKEKDTPATIAEAKAQAEAAEEPIPDIESPDFDRRFLSHPAVRIPGSRRRDRMGRTVPMGVHS